MIDLFVEVPAYRALDSEDQLKVQELLRKCSGKNEALKACTKLAEQLKNNLTIGGLKKSSLLGDRFFNCTFDNYTPYTPETQKAFDVAKKYALNFSDYEQKGTGLIFQGNGCVGTGKTHLACAIANHLMDNYFIPVKFGMIVDLLDELKKSFGSDADLISHLSGIELLIIDDLGKEQPTAWAISVINQVINNRYARLKPIIVTTEIGIDHLATVYGKAIPSRLCQMNAVVNLIGEDYRLRG